MTRTFWCVIPAWDSGISVSVTFVTLGRPHSQSRSNDPFRPLCCQYHTLTPLTPPREWAPGPVCQSASAKVTPTKSWRSLDISQEQSGWGVVGVQGGKLTAKNNRDSRVPEAALTSAAPVKGQELRGSDRGGQTATSHNNLLTSAGGSQDAYGIHVTCDPFICQSSQDKTTHIKVT